MCQGLPPKCLWGAALDERPTLSQTDVEPEEGLLMDYCPL